MAALTFQRESRVLAPHLPMGVQLTVGRDNLWERVFHGSLDESRSTLTGFNPARGRQVTRYGGHLAANRACFPVGDRQLC